MSEVTNTCRTCINKERRAINEYGGGRRFCILTNEPIPRPDSTCKYYKPTEKAIIKDHESTIANLRAELERYHWIPVKERLPEIDALVLLYLENEKESKITTGKIYKSDNPQFDGEFCIGFDPICPDFLKREYVTHWMPLPMGPEGVERDG